MYYELMSKPPIKITKREYIIKHKEEIIKIVGEMLQPDAPKKYENYNIYKDCFATFSQEIIEKHLVLNAPHIEYITDDAELIGKNILLRPKTKTIIECMKKI